MPGSSLWLVPPEDSPLYAVLHHLILEEIPSLFSNDTQNTLPPAFTPHVTLTADTVLTNGTAPQAWLDAISLGVLSTSSPSSHSGESAHNRQDPTSSSSNNSSSSKLTVTVRQVHVGHVFFRKLTLLCEKTPALRNLAAHCRAAAVGASRLAAGDDVMISGDDDEEIARAEAWVGENYTPHASLMYSDLPTEQVTAKLDEATKLVQAAARQTRSEGTKTTTTTTTQGASIWLVPTNKPLDEWAPVAKRGIENVEWFWET